MDMMIILSVICMFPVILYCIHAIINPEETLRNTEKKIDKVAIKRRRYDAILFLVVITITIVFIIAI